MGDRLSVPNVAEVCPLPISERISIRDESVAINRVAADHQSVVLLHGHSALGCPTFFADSARPGAWAAPPRAWPEDKLLERETLGVIGTAIDKLPEAQREVIRLRDLEGWSPMEVSDALMITDGNQRVLLHRARSKVRAALEMYLNPEVVEGTR